MSLETHKSGGPLLTLYFWIVVAYLLLPILIIVPTSFSAQDFLQFPPRTYLVYLTVDI